MTGTRGPADLTLRRLLERLSDVELAEMLREECCDGPLWLLVREDLARRTLGTMHAYVRGGELADRTRRLGRPVVLDPDEDRMLRTDRDERSTVLSDAVVHGLGHFRDHGILRRAWRPDRSSLRMLALTCCLRETSRAVHVWRRGGKQHPAPHVEEIEPDPDFGTEPVDVDDAPLPDELRRAVRVRLRTGLTWAAIAPDVGTTARTIEDQLHRFRQEHGRRNGGERS